MGLRFQSPNYWAMIRSGSPTRTPHSQPTLTPLIPENPFLPYLCGVQWPLIGQRMLNHFASLGCRSVDAIQPHPDHQSTRFLKIPKRTGRWWYGDTVTRSGPSPRFPSVNAYIATGGDKGANEAIARLQWRRQCVKQLLTLGRTEVCSIKDERTPKTSAMSWAVGVGCVAHACRPRTTRVQDLPGSCATTHPLVWSR